MKICVLVKQAPDANEGEHNPPGLYAVEEAVRIRKRFCEEAEITVISLGPPAAARVLRSALALGCDNACLLSDPRFGGIDTWSTSYVLRQGIEALGSFGLILCGDGEVGPGVAAHFDIPVISSVSCIEGLDDGWIVARRTIEGGHEVIEAPLPVLLTLAGEINQTRAPFPEGDRYSLEKEIYNLEAEDIGVDAGRIGLRNSLTCLVKVFYPDEIMRTGCDACQGINFV